MKTRYFKQKDHFPEPLQARTFRIVRFEEVDSLGIVWHGRYPSYFEDARVALGDKYGIGYMDFYCNKVLAPIKKMHIDYFLPLRFQDQFEIQALLYWSEAARINHEFKIVNHDQELVAQGYSVQMFVDKDGQYMLSMPDFYARFCENWNQGRIE